MMRDLMGTLTLLIILIVIFEFAAALYTVRCFYENDRSAKVQRIGLKGEERLSRILRGCGAVARCASPGAPAARGSEVVKPYS